VISENKQMIYHLKKKKKKEKKGKKKDVDSAGKSLRQD